MVLISYLIQLYRGRGFPTFTEVHDKKWYFVRCATNYLVFLFMTYGFKYLKLSTVICFLSLNPVLVVLFAIAVLHEKFYYRYLFGIMICFGGASLLIFNDNCNVKYITEFNLNVTLNSSTDEFNFEYGMKSHHDKLENQNKNLTLSNLNFRNIIEIAQKNQTTQTTKTSPTTQISQTPPFSIHLQDFLGLIFGLGTTFFMALQLLAIKIVSHEPVNIDDSMIYLGIVNVILGLIYTSIFASFSEFICSTWVYILLIVNSILFISAQKLLQMSYINIDMGKLTSVGYVQIVIAFILGALFLNESVALVDILGSLIIFGYNTYAAIYPIKDLD